MHASKQDLAGRALIAALLAWACPGLGHLYLGRQSKALLLGGSIAVIFFAGMLIGGGGVVSPIHKPIWFAGHAFGGGLTGLALLIGQPAMASDPTPAHELGVLYTCIAALCNFLLVLDAAGTAWRDDKALAPAPAAAAASTVGEETVDEAP